MSLPITMKTAIFITGPMDGQLVNNELSRLSHVAVPVIKKHRIIKEVDSYEDVEPDYLHRFVYRRCFMDRLTGASITRYVFFAPVDMADESIIRTAEMWIEKNPSSPPIPPAALPAVLDPPA